MLYKQLYIKEEPPRAIGRERRKTIYLVLETSTTKEGANTGSTLAEDVEQEVELDTLSLVERCDIRPSPKGNEHIIQIAYLEIVLRPLCRRNSPLGIASPLRHTPDTLGSGVLVGARAPGGIVKE
jgi:hypothetical protein